MEKIKKYNLTDFVLFIVPQQLFVVVVYFVFYPPCSNSLLIGNILRIKNFQRKEM